MTGTLGLFSLVDLFQLLSSSERTGRLKIDHPKGDARVYFDDGRVIHASFGELDGEEAVYALFNDERGAFEFGLGLPAPETSIETSTENLMLEAIRRLDEARRTVTPAEVITENSVPMFSDAAPDSGGLRLQPQEIAVMRFIDGRQTVEQISSLAGVALEETRTIISRLVDINALTLKTRKPRTARLVTQLSDENLPSGVVGIDTFILANWAKVMGQTPDKVACRREDGTVNIFMVRPAENAGPYMLLSRDTLFAKNIQANTPMLVKPFKRKSGVD